MPAGSDSDPEPKAWPVRVGVTTRHWLSTPTRARLSNWSEGEAGAKESGWRREGWSGVITGRGR